MTKTFITLFMTLLLSSVSFAQRGPGHGSGSGFGHGPGFGQGPGFGHGHGHKKFNHQKAIKITMDYIRVLKEFQQLTKRKSLFGISRQTANLIDTVKFSILRPLKHGQKQKIVRAGLKNVHADVRQVHYEIECDWPGKKIVEKFRSTNQVQKIRLMKFLDK